MLTKIIPVRLLESTNQENGRPVTASFQSCLPLTRTHAQLRFHNVADEPQNQKELCWECSGSVDIVIVTSETLQVERPDPNPLRLLSE